MANHPCFGQGHDLLVVHHELAPGDRVPELALDREADHGLARAGRAVLEVASLGGAAWWTVKA
ncbi:MAG: hypothetical protein ABIP19_07835 [Dermatophilaceae bacterium]